MTEQINQQTGEITTPNTADLSNVPSGRYCYQPPDGQAQFYKIDNLRLDKKEGEKWHGWIFVKAIYGGGGEERVGAQRPDSATYAGPRMPAMQAIVKDPLSACQLYGQLIGSCGICGRSLTNAESRAFGIGPECRGKL